MIKSALVAMVVIGCDCDGKMCEFISQTPAQWTSVSACEAALTHQALNGRMDYPVVTGICKAQNPDGSAVLAADTAPAQPAALAPAPMVEPVAYSGLVAGSQAILHRTAHGYTAIRDTLGRAASGTAGLARRTGGRFVDRLTESF